MPLPTNFFYLQYFIDRSKERSTYSLIVCLCANIKIIYLKNDQNSLSYDDFMHRFKGVIDMQISFSNELGNIGVSSQLVTFLKTCEKRIPK